MSVIEFFKVFGGTLIVIVFQLVKMLINNHKMKKEFSKIKANDPKVIANEIDYDKLANLIMEIYLKEKNKNDKEKK